MKKLLLIAVVALGVAACTPEPIYDYCDDNYDAYGYYIGQTCGYYR